MTRATVAIASAALLISAGAALWTQDQQLRAAWLERDAERDMHRRCEERWFGPLEERPDERPLVTVYPKNWTCGQGRDGRWACFRRVEP